jgi:hypothetical protein
MALFLTPPPPPAEVLHGMKEGGEGGEGVGGGGGGGRGGFNFSLSSGHYRVPATQAHPPYIHVLYIHIHTCTVTLSYEAYVYFLPCYNWEPAR